MGAWGHRTFEDDTTCDWVWELADSPDPLSFISSSLTLDGSDEYLEYDTGASVLAASEAVYAIAFGVRDGAPDDLKAWATSHADLDVSSIFAKCVAGLTRLLSDNSELNELWSENEELYPKWRANAQQMIDAFSAG